MPTHFTPPCPCRLSAAHRIIVICGRRQAICAQYHAGLAGEETVQCVQAPLIKQNAILIRGCVLQEVDGTTNAHHLMVIRLVLDKLTKTRDDV